MYDARRFHSRVTWAVGNTGTRRNCDDNSRIQRSQIRRLRGVVQGMITVNLTANELRLIRDALYSEYYLAKDEGDSYTQNRITALETKLSKEENNDAN